MRFVIFLKLKLHVELRIFFTLFNKHDCLLYNKAQTIKKYRSNSTFHVHEEQTFWNIGKLTITQLCTVSEI